MKKQKKKKKKASRKKNANASTTSSSSSSSSSFSSSLNTTKTMRRSFAIPKMKSTSNTQTVPNVTSSSATSSSATTSSSVTSSFNFSHSLFRGSNPTTLETKDILKMKETAETTLRLVEKRIAPLISNLKVPKLVNISTTTTSTSTKKTISKKENMEDSNSDSEEEDEDEDEEQEQEMSPLFEAVFLSALPKVVEMFNNNGSNKSNAREKHSSGMTLFHSCVQWRETKILKWLIENQPDILNDATTPSELDGMTPLLASCVCEKDESIDYSLVKYLLSLKDVSKGISVPAKDGITVVHLAVQDGDTKIVKLLIENCQDRSGGQLVRIVDSITGRTPLLDSIQNGDYPMVKLLCELDAKQTKMDAMNDASNSNSSTNSTNSTNSTLNLNSTLRQADKSGWSPFLLATAGGDTDINILRYLYNHGANVDIDAANSSGLTPSKENFSPVFHLFLFYKRS